MLCFFSDLKCNFVVILQPGLFPHPGHVGKQQQLDSTISSILSPSPFVRVFRSNSLRLSFDQMYSPFISKYLNIWQGLPILATQIAYRLRQRPQGQKCLLHHYVSIYIQYRYQLYQLYQLAEQLKPILTSQYRYQLCSQLISILAALPAIASYFG